MKLKNDLPRNFNVKFVVDSFDELAEMEILSKGGELPTAVASQKNQHIAS
jgi:hypothetical protein